jgi:two-component system response regulator YesN
VGKVMIVDDELLVRIGLRSTISWQKYGFTIVADAANGQEAIQKFTATDPDILITDIRMPGMDGIELIKILKKRKPKLKTVILTNYDDFAYTQEALKLGADEYLLKSTLDNQTLLPILERLWSKVQQESVEDQRLEKLQKQALLGFSLLKKHFVERLISGELDEQVYHDFLQDLGLDLQENNWQLIFMKGDNQEETTARSDLRPLNLIEEITDKVGALVAEGSSAEEWILIYSFPEKEASYYRKKIIPFNIRQIQTCLKQYLQIKTTAVFGSVLTCYRQLPAEYTKARESMMYRFFWPEKQMLFPEDLPGETKDYCLLESNDQNLSALIRMGDQKQVRKALEGLFNNVTEKKSPFLLRQFCQELYGEMARQCREGGISLSEILGEDEQYPSHLENFQSIPAIRDWFAEKLDQLMTTIKRAGLMHYSTPIREALIYIKENYHNKNLSLSLVANQVGLSKNHFCTRFKEETGNNFVDFLHKTRCEQARELLLHSELLIAEIAELVGYIDPKYFTKVFQRQLGYSPAIYRKLCQKGGRPDEKA